MKAESPDKGTIAQVYLLRPVLPHLRTRIPKVENIKMPVAYGIEKPRFVRPNRQATALPGHGLRHIQIQALLFSRRFLQKCVIYCNKDSSRG